MFSFNSTQKYRCSLTLPHLRLFTSGKIKPVIYDQSFTLERLSDGLAAIERRESWGKVVVRVKEEGTNERAKL